MALLLRTAPNRLELTNHCTLSDALIPGAIIVPGQGILGWIYREGRAVHVTRFDRDTRTLGIYQRDVGIKALLAAPLPNSAGVLMIDSKSRYAFPEKRQKMFRNCPQIVLDLLDVQRQEARLSFMERFHDLQLELLYSVTSPLQVIARHIGAHSGLSAVMESDAKDRYQVVETYGQWRDTLVLKRRFSAGDGLIGWSFRHKRHLHLKRTISKRQYLLHKNERVPKAGKLIIIHLEEDGWSRVFAFNGDFDFSLYPKGFEALLVQGIRESLRRS